MTLFKQGVTQFVTNSSLHFETMAPLGPKYSETWTAKDTMDLKQLFILYRVRYLPRPWLVRTDTNNWRYVEVHTEPTFTPSDD